MATVSNNYITGSGGTGICVVEAKNVIIESNIIKDGLSHCIRLRDTFYDGEDGAPNGDSEQGSDNSIVSNNLCINNVYGINVENTDSAVVNGNRVSLSTLYSDNGIQFKKTTNSIAFGNNLCGTTGFTSNDDDGSNMVVNNLVCNTVTQSPTEAPTYEGMPTNSPTPAPTFNLSSITPQTVTLLANEQVTYNTDDDRLFDTWKDQNNDFLTTDLSAWADGYRLKDRCSLHHENLFR